FLLYKSFHCPNPITAGQMPEFHGLLASFSRLIFGHRWHPTFQTDLAASRSPTSSRCQSRRYRRQFRRSIGPSSEASVKGCSIAALPCGLLHKRASSSSLTSLFAASPFPVKAFSIFQLVGIPKFPDQVPGFP